MDDTTQQKAKMTAKDFFLYLGMAVTLYVSAVSLLQLLFSVINDVFIDQLDSYVDPYSSAVRWGIAMLVIFFPLYLWLSSVVSKGERMDTQKRSLWVRKWLGYLTLFVAGLAIAVDLVVLVFNFLDGEITTRFFLKVLAVLVVAGGIFWHYISELRRDVTESGPRKLFVSIAAGLIVASLVAGFLVMGSPVTQRKLRFDERRVQDLQNIQQQVVEYWRSKGELPPDLNALKNEISGFIPPTDPRTGEPYTYKDDGGKGFEICAVFELDNRDLSGTRPSTPYLENWSHYAGPKCFARTIDPELYPPYDKTGIPKPVMYQ